MGGLGGGGGVVCDVPVCPILIVGLPAFVSSIPSAYRIGGPQILDHMLRSFLLDGINAPLFWGGSWKFPLYHLAFRSSPRRGRSNNRQSMGESDHDTICGACS
jgi:hypothetical protein